MELWVLLTLAAAFLQNLRSLLQKRLTGVLSSNGASYVRFCYALPFALIYVAVLIREQGLPGTTPGFWAYCLAGSVAQLLASASLLSAFTLRSFAVSTALSKTEAVQAAVFGFVLLGDSLSAGAVAGLAVSLLGVLLLTSALRPADFLRSERGLLLGLLAGAGLAVAAVCFRGAAVALEEGSAMLRAASALTVALIVQTVMMAAYLRLREPGELGRVGFAWRRGIWVGLFGVAASVGWFTAMALEAAALVRALGQVELLFALITSWLVFRERLRARELVGVALLLGGIYLLLVPGAA